MDGELDWVTIKYSTDGDELWKVYSNGTEGSEDIPRALALDVEGNVYVSGHIDGLFCTIKYYSDGTQAWLSNYNGSGSVKAIVVDSSGYVYMMARYGSVPNADYFTIKYSQDGSQEWASRFNGPENSDDHPSSFAVDSRGNVFVTGMSWVRGIGNTYTTIKYTPTGTEDWIAQYHGPSVGGNEALSMAVDDEGCAYITGYDDTSRMTTIKYSTNGMVSWISNYRAPGSKQSKGYSLAIDDFGDILVTGVSRYEDFDITTTIKYTQAGDPVSTKPESMPKQFHLEQNYPNPFNPSTRIKINIPVAGRYKLLVYNILGETVSTLVNGYQDAGVYTIDFDGSQLSSGLYFYNISGSNVNITRKMMLLK